MFAGFSGNASGFCGSESRQIRALNYDPKLYIHTTYGAIRNL
jgi:hypothetical protein